MLVKMLLHKKGEGYQSLTKRMDKRRYERLQAKLGMIENGVELVKLEIINQ